MTDYTNYSSLTRYGMSHTQDSPLTWLALVFAILYIIGRIL